jgi:hypothetical protein
LASSTYRTGSLLSILPVGFATMPITRVRTGLYRDLAVDMKAFIPVVSMILMTVGAAEGKTWLVPSERPTVAAGIAAAAADDTVLIACGTYAEHGLVMKSGIVLLGQSGGGCVTIDAGAADRVMVCNNLSAGTRIERITLTGGDATGLPGSPYGGGVLCAGGSPIFKQCRFVGNSATVGGGMFCSDADPRLDACEFSANSAGDGGGLYCRLNSKPNLIDCIFSGNAAVDGGYESGGGGIFCDTSDAVLSGCVFLQNSAGRGGGALCFFCQSSFENCTFALNVGLFGASGILCIRANPALRGCIIAFGQGGESLLIEFSSQPTLTNCDIFGNPGNNWPDPIDEQLGSAGNFMADPGFCNRDTGDLTLCADSWCLPGRLPDGTSHGLVGALGAGCQACSPMHSEPMSWGEVKSRYR